MQQVKSHSAWKLPTSTHTNLPTATSRKRGNLAAGWFADFLSEQGDSEIESFALLGGVLGWATAGEEFTDLMEGYEEEVWKRDHSGH
jgi:arsenical-resistance protein 2